MTSKFVLSIGVTLWMCCSVVFALEPGEFFTRGSRDFQAVAISFDDGPSLTYTPQVLEILEEHHIKTTFFVLGQQVDKFPHALAAVVKAGHEIGNHTRTHLNLYSIQEDDLVKQLKSEVLWTHEIIQKSVGIQPDLLRIPYGYSRPWTKQVAKELGYVLVNWTAGYDWRDLDPEETLQFYVEAIKSGAIFLFHDGGGKRKKTLWVLKKFLPELKRRKYQILTVGELLRLGTKNKGLVNYQILISSP